MKICAVFGKPVVDAYNAQSRLIPIYIKVGKAPKLTVNSYISKRP